MINGKFVLEMMNDECKIVEKLEKQVCLGSGHFHVCLSGHMAGYNLHKAMKRSVQWAIHSKLGVSMGEWKKQNKT